MKKFHWLFATMFLTSLAALFHFGLSRIADLDSFYYIRQSWLLRTGGLFNVDFPWMQLSVIKNLSSSLWYGFAFLLIPFTILSNLFLGIKVAGVIFTTGALLSYYWVMNRHQLRWPLAWPLVLFFLAPNVLTQFLMVRPQIISLALTPILFSLLIGRGFWAIGFVTFGIAWAHLNFAWVPVLIFGIVAAFQLFFSGITKKALLQRAGMVFGGIMLGWLFRPNPFGALKLFYIQVVQQVFQKQGGLPLLFGKENLPLDLSVLMRNFSPFLVILLIAVLVIWIQGRQYKFLTPDRKVLIWSSAGLSMVFFLFTILVARRTYNFWAEFGIIFIAAVFSYFISEKTFRRIILLALFFLCLYMGPKGWVAISKSGYELNEFKEAALWLENNSNPRDIVFNLHWPDFSPLFFWNQKNYYVGGLDPIFQYSYNPSFYWKYHYLSLDVVTKKTCPAIACTVSMLEDTYLSLKNDFNAKYFILDQAENPAIRQWLEEDVRFEKKLDTGAKAIYLIK